MKKYWKLAMVFLVGFIGGIAGTVIATLFQVNQTHSTRPIQTTSVSNVTYKNKTSTTEAVKTVQDAVVSVINYQQAGKGGVRSIFGLETGSNDDELAVAGEGSGVIYKKEGNTAYLVTNTHVITSAEKIDVQLASGDKVEGELIGADTYSDIAVIKISSAKVSTVAEFADSDSINVGETAIAIGSPLGSVYSNSVTQGIVSSLSRTVTSQTEDGQTISTNAIQTDTAINPGNSGGPLINIQGQVIGITSSKITSIPAYDSSVSVEGMGFAIPSNDVVTIINHLEQDGKVIRPALGIKMLDITELSINQLKTAGLLDSDLTAGVVVVYTQAGLPAAGKLQKYDVITQIKSTEKKSKARAMCRVSFTNTRLVKPLPLPSIVTVRNSLWISN